MTIKLTHWIYEQSYQVQAKLDKKISVDECSIVTIEGWLLLRKVY